MLPLANVALIVLLTDEPTVTDLFPKLVREKSNVTGSDTVSLKEVERDTPPSLPVTPIGNVPVGVELLVDIVRVEEQVGLQDTLEKDELTPLGNPDTEKEIGLPLPDLSAALITFCAEDPFWVALSPVLESEKSNC